LASEILKKLEKFEGKDTSNLGNETL